MQIADGETHSNPPPLLRSTAHDHLYRNLQVARESRSDLPIGVRIVKQRVSTSVNAGWYD